MNDETTKPNAEATTAGEQAAQTPSPSPLARTHAWLVNPWLQYAVLLVISLSINFYRLHDTPPWPHFFEDAAILGYRDYRAALDAPWHELLTKFSVWEPGDTDDTGQSLVFAYIVHKSARWLGGTETQPPSARNVFAYRLPNALLSSLVPIAIAALVGRFFRRDIAFAAGLLTAANPVFVTLARNAGYDACTALLLIGLVYFAFRIVHEDSLWSWIPLTVILALVPYFYSPFRYMWFLIIPPILYRLVTSPQFRVRHGWVVPTVILVQLLLAQNNIIAKQSLPKAFTHFYNATGENVFSYNHPEHFIPEGIQEDVDYESRWSVGARALWFRLGQTAKMYVLGHKVSPPLHPHGGNDSLRFVPYAMTWFFLLGFVYALWLGWRNWRYLLYPAWSVWIFTPLLLSTDVNANRTVMGIPSDMVLVALGLMLPFDVVRRWLPKSVAWVPLLVVYGVVLWFCVMGLRYYISQQLLYG